jgi:tetratricopeptide (TPR) repeat protein
MATETPIIRQNSWLVAMPSLVVLAAAFMLGVYLDGRRGFFIAGGCYIAYSIAARALVAREQRRGIRLVRANRFAEAIPHFERSFEFFDRHRWLDDWRGLVLLSSNRASYREMALLNIAFCLTQVGDGPRAAETYQRCLDLFPESGMAQAALRTLAAAARPGV